MIDNCDGYSIVESVSSPPKNRIAAFRKRDLTVSQLLTPNVLCLLLKNLCHLAHIAGDNAHSMALQVQSYLEEVAAWSNTFDIRGREGDRATYEELYIPPAFYLQPNTSQRRGRGFGKREVATSEEVNPASILSQLATKRNRGRCARLLIQAGSGMGKTTYVKGLSAGIAQARINGDATIFTLLTQSEQSAPLMEWTPVLIAQPEGDLAGTGFEALGRDEELAAEKKRLIGELALAERKNPKGGASAPRRKTNTKPKGEQDVEK